MLALLKLQYFLRGSCPWNPSRWRKMFMLLSSATIFLSKVLDILHLAPTSVFLYFVKAQQDNIHLLHYQWSNYTLNFDRPHPISDETKICPSAFRGTDEEQEVWVHIHQASSPSLPRWPLHIHSASAADSLPGRRLKINGLQIITPDHFQTWQPRRSLWLCLGTHLCICKVGTLSAMMC